MTIIEEMARWVASLKYEDIPASVLDRAKIQVLGIVAAAHAGGISPASKKLLAAVRSWGQNGDIPVLSTGERTSLHSALFANAALSMAHDYDDYLFLAHTGHSAVFASMLTALKEGKSVKDMLVAVVAANELGGRMGAACLIGPQNGQVWTFVHLVESAAAAAKLYGLNAKQIAHAIAISLYQPNFALVPGFMGPDTKALSASQTSLGGLMAADLARQDFTGPLDVIENRQGFLHQFSYAPMEFMLTGFGKSWVTQSIAYKLVPGCAYIDTAVDAMEMILEKFKQATGKEIEPTDVREITVKASMLTTEMDRLSETYVSKGDLNPIAINFSIAANLAIMVLAGDLRVEHLDPDWLELHKEDIMSLIRRTRLEHDWAMSLGVNNAFRKILDLGRIVDEVGLKNLIVGRRKVAEHLGGGLSLGIKDLAEMRKTAGPEGREAVGRMVSGAWKRLVGPKRRAGASGPLDLGKSDFTLFRMPFAAEVTIKTADWKEYSARQDIPWGGPGHLWEDTARRVKEKFRREARRNLSDEQIKWVIDHTDGMEKVSSVRELIDNLAHKPGAKARAPKEREQRERREEKPEFKSRRSAPRPPLPEIPREKEKAPPPPPPPPKKQEDELDLPPIVIEPLRKPVAPEPRRYRDEAPRPRREDLREDRPAERFSRTEAPVRDRQPSPVRDRPSAPMRDRSPEPVRERPPAPPIEEPAAEKKTTGVTMRRAKPREKSPRPPKGAKRMRMRRP